MKLLYINACVRRSSRTHRIATALIEKLTTDDSISVEEVHLDGLGLLPLNEERLRARDDLIIKRAWDHPSFSLARQFANADLIVISAPYWDGSFPALLKLYIENIYVTDLVSRYDDQGRPIGLCKAKKLYYVTTAGGSYDPRYSFDLMADLAVNSLGMGSAELIKAEGLDIIGNDAEAIINEVIRRL